MYEIYATAGIVDDGTQFVNPVQPMIDSGEGFKQHPSNYFTHRPIYAGLERERQHQFQAEETSIDGLQQPSDLRNCRLAARHKTVNIFVGAARWEVYTTPNARVHFTARYGVGSEKSMEKLQLARRTAAARLDRLPILSIHRKIMWIVGIIFFFEVADVNTFAFAAPAIMNAWNLSISTISFVVSATFIGMFFGAVTGGWFSDRVGRKKALIITTIWYSGFSLLNAAVQGTAGLFITRLLTGVGVAATTVICMTYVSEIFPAKQRGSYQGWVMMIGLAGIPVTAYVARFTVPIASWGWRLVFVWGSLGLLVLLFANYLEESPRWYDNRGNLAEADAVLERIEACGRAEFR